MTQASPNTIAPHTAAHFVAHHATENAAGPLPENIVLHQKSRTLELQYPGGQAFSIAFELMRVYSPSAEVQGHGPGQEVLQTGKRGVLIESLATVGHYALQPRFSDGHDSGIYTWQYLHFLGQHQQRLWDEYLQRLHAAGASRDADAEAAAHSHPHVHGHGGCGGGGGCGCSH